MRERHIGRLASKFGSPDASETVGARENLLINGAFRINQRNQTYTSTSSPSNSDDNYLVDMWNLLSDGNDIVDVSINQIDITPALANVPPDGGQSSICLDVETANKKFGIIQFVESYVFNAKHNVGTPLSLSFKMKRVGSSLTNIRAAILCLDVASIDSLTSDVVSTWNSASTNPTLSSTWEYLNVPATLTPGTDWATFEIQNVSITTSDPSNLAVFIWSDSTTTTVADRLYISDVKLEVGEFATEFVHRQYGDELRLCQRYYVRFPSPSSDNIILGTGYTQDSTHATVIVPLPVEMRSQPLSSVSAAADFSVITAGTTEVACTSLSSSSVVIRSKRTLVLDATVASGLTAGRAVLFASATGASAIALEATAEL